MDTKISIILFKKTGTQYTILDYKSSLNLSNIIDMKEFVYAKSSFLTNSITEDGIYKWVGVLELKRTRLHARTTGYSKMKDDTQVKLI